MNQWQQLVNQGVFKTKKVYYSLVDEKPKVPWRKLMYDIMNLLLELCLQSGCLATILTTKDKLSKVSFIKEDKCEFYPKKRRMYNICFLVEYHQIDLDWCV